MTTDHEICVHNEREIAHIKELLDREVRRLDEKSALAEAESLRARQVANEWRSAMVDREARFAPATAVVAVQKDIDGIHSALSEWQGRRVAWIAAAGIIATVIAVGVGQVIRQGITAADVSNQIQREAPWNRDKAGVERRITVIERQTNLNSLELSKLQQRVDAICGDHTPKVC